MSSEGDDLAADLKVLADTLLARLGPVLRRAASAGDHGGSAGDNPKPEWQGCSWCPVCALAAALRGEQHDLLTLLSVEGAALIAIVRDFLAAHGADLGSGSSGPVGSDSSASPDRDAARGPHSDARAAGLDAGATELGQDVSPDAERQPTSRSQFIPITVTTTQSPTEDRSRP